MENHERETPHVLDCIGLSCPEPVMLLHTRVKALKTGDVLKIEATDPTTQWDIPKFCRFLGHELIDKTIDGDRFEYWIRIAE